MLFRRFVQQTARLIRKPHQAKPRQLLPCRGCIESLEQRTLLAAPTILSESFNRDGTQSISVQFSTNVSASIDNTTLILYNLSNLTTMPGTSIGYSYNTTTNTATWSVNYTPPGATLTHFLPDDGNYQAILYADRVTDSSGTPMAANSTFSFTNFKGDANGDKIINALDFNALASNYGKTSRVFSQGDFDHNGTVNSSDFSILAGRFGQTLAAAKPAPRQMDVVTFNASPDGSADHYNQTMFNAQNTPQPGGYMMFMGSDAQRANLAAQGNSLGIYYNNFTSNIDIANPSTMINAVETWCTNLFTSTGVQPTWLTLNEISSSTWQGSNGTAYRTWLTTVIHALHEVYGHEIVLYAPFANPGNFSTTWQALAKDSYIGVENYLSGHEMSSHSFSVSWAEGQYKSSITSYNNLGVSDSRLIEGEEYSLTAPTINPDGSITYTGIGRDGVSLADWDSTIIARAEAIHDLGLYYGSIGYAWSKNAMLDTEADQIHFEQTYRAQVLP